MSSPSNERSTNMEGTQMKRNDPYDTGSGAEPTSFMPPAGRIDHGTTRGDSGLEGAPKKASLQGMIVHLKQAVKAKQQQVALLSGQVETLQTKVTGLETTVADDQREMATISYVIGTKKELENSGVIVAKGGVLGLGKTVQLTGNLDQTLVSELNTDEETIVRANATKAKVLSPQPPSSYELTLVGGQMELRILDPKEFRKVKHLIILTA